MIHLADFCRGGAAAFCDVPVPVERLRSFAAESIGHFTKAFQNDDAGRCSIEMKQDVRQAAMLARELGLIESTTFQEEPASVAAVEGSISLTGWLHPQGDRGIMLQDLAPPPLASAIAATAALGETAFSGTYHIEPLLRQIEVRRFSTATLTPERRNREFARQLVADVAVFLSRYSFRTRDARVLNSAFKINDREFPGHVRLLARSSTTRYLLAIVEQERAALELLS